ncbi:MAG: O-antigen ligase family protein [Sphingomonadaceae bacterium]|nr:O-antigen ligase family protein [Sphingomonadaceae bacterium]
MTTYRIAGLNPPRRPLGARLRALLSAKAAPVLDGYQVERAPLRRWLRRNFVLSLIALSAVIYGVLFTIMPLAFVVFLALPIVVLALTVIWALPEIGHAPVRLVNRLFYLLFGVMLLWPNYIALDFGGLPWISLRRIVVAPLILLFLIALSVSRAFRKQLTDVLVTIPAMWKLMVFFVAVQTLSIGMSTAPLASIKLWLNDQAFWTAVFFICAYVFAREGAITRWVKLMVCIAIVLSIVGVVEARAQHVLWLNHIPSFLRIDDQAVQEMLKAHFRDGGYRASSTFTVPLAFAEFLAVMTPFVAHYVVTTRTTVERVFFVLADLLIFIAILTTGARLGIVGFLAGHLCYIFLWSVRKWRWGGRSLIGPTLTIPYPLLAFAFVLSAIYVPAVHNRVLGGGSSGFSDDARKIQYQMARPKWLHSPLIGYGPGESGDVLGFFTEGGVLTVDSYPLSLSLDYGFLGLISFVSMLVIGVVRMVRVATLAAGEASIEMAAPLACAIVVFMTTKLVLSQEDNNPLVYAFLAMAVAIEYRRERLATAARPRGTLLEI